MTKKPARPPKRKAVIAELVARVGGEAVASAEGLIDIGPDGATFRRLDDGGDIKNAAFPDWTARGAGRPRRQMRDAMTAILRNRLDMHRFSETSHERAEEFAGRPPRTLARHRAFAERFVRSFRVLQMEDGRALAIAFVRYGSASETSDGGPAWVLWGGDEHAQLIADCRLEQIDE